MRTTCMILGMFIAFALAQGSTAKELTTDLSWPQFRGPQRTGVSASADLLTEWPDGGPKLLWTAEGAGLGYATVAIADGKLFTIGDGPSTADSPDSHLICFDVRNGTQLWKSRIGKPWKEGPNDWHSSRSTPTLDGDRIYALTGHGELVCANVTDGSEVWRKNLKDDFGGKKGDSWGYSESVLIDGDRLICTPGGEEKTMIALKKDTGDLVWSSVREGDRGAGHSSIVISQIGNAKVYVQTTSGGALGVRASDGKLMWSYPIESTTAVIPTPIVREDLVFFSAGYGRGGALLRQVPAVGGDVEMKEIYPLNRELNNKHGGIVLVGDHLYGDSDANGIPWCADFETGEVRWKKRGSGKGSASITAAEGHLYIWYSNSVMVLAKASPEEYQEVSSFEIEGGERPSWAHPVILGGRLYLRRDDQIFCYDLRAG